MTQQMRLLEAHTAEVERDIRIITNGTAPESARVERLRTLAERRRGRSRQESVDGTVMPASEFWASLHSQMADLYDTAADRIEGSLKPTLSCPKCGVPNRAEYRIEVDLFRDLATVLGHQSAWLDSSCTIFMCAEHMPQPDRSDPEWVRPLLRFDDHHEWIIRSVDVRGG